MTGCLHSSCCLQAGKPSWDKHSDVTWQTCSMLYKGLYRKKLAQFPSLRSTHSCPDLSYIHFFYPFLVTSHHKRYSVHPFLFAVPTQYGIDSFQYPFFFAVLPQIKIRFSLASLQLSMLNEQCYGDGTMLKCSPSHREGAQALVHPYQCYPENKQDSWL